MIIVLNIDSEKFSLNGIPYFKNFTPHVVGGKLKIVNVYDSKFELAELDNFSNFSVNGVVHTSLVNLQNALLPVIYSRNSLGGATDVEGKLDKDGYTGTAQTLADDIEALGSIDLSVKLDKDGYIGTAQDLSDAIDNKLDIADYNEHFKGVYLTLSDLNTAHPTASIGDYAQVNEVGATDVVNYNWDAEKSTWIKNAVQSTPISNTDALPEGASNLYFTVTRFLANLTFANIISALGFTPENISSKQNSLDTDGTGVKYPTVDAVNVGLNLKLNGTNTSEFYRNIYYTGDSLTEDGTYIYTVSSVIGNTWNNFNTAISGSTTGGMLSRFSSDILNKKNPSHVVVLGGTNDVTSLVPAATIQANLQSIYTAAYNAGIKVIAVTITPRITTAPQLAIQQAVNNWIKTTAINIDYVVDPYLTLADPANPTQLLPSYTTDGLHMTTLGYVTLGNYIGNNVTWIAKENTTKLKMDVKGYASSNQELYTSSDAIFKSLNTLTVGTGTGNVYTNTAVGKLTLESNTYGKLNTALGYSSLNKNTSGANNTAAGYFSLAKNTTGSNNTAIGNNSLASNTTGSANTAIGYFAMLSNTTGGSNVGIGQSALQGNTSGTLNSAIGLNSLVSNTTGSGNTAFGSFSLFKNIGATNNSAFGNSSLYNNTTGVTNSGFGFNSLLSNTTGSFNVAIGATSLQNNISSGENTAIGYGASTNSTSSKNTVLGATAGIGITSGGENTIIGYASGFSAFGSGNVFLGNKSGYFETGSNKLYIDNNQRLNESDGRTKALVYGQFDASISNQFLTINGNLNLGLTPTTSASTYDVLTRNTSTGVVEKKLSSDFATVLIPNDATVASASNVGKFRYYTSGNNSYVDMCMQTGASTYAWTNITQNNW